MSSRSRSTCRDGPTSGRLVTTVVAGDGCRLRRRGRVAPAVDDLQRAEAWGSSEARPLGRSDAAQSPGAVLARPGAAREARAHPRRRPLGPAAQARAQQRHDRRRARAAPRARSSSAPPRPCASCPTAKTSSPRTAAATTPRSAHSTPSARARSSSSRRAARPDRARSATSSRSAPTPADAAGIVTDGGVRDAEAVASVGIPVFSQRRPPRRPRPQARPVGRGRDDRMRRHDRAAGRHHRRRRRRRHRHPARASPRRSSTPRSRRRTRTPGSPRASRRGIPSTGSSR